MTESLQKIRIHNQKNEKLIVILEPNADEREIDKGKHVDIKFIVTGQYKIELDIIDISILDNKIILFDSAEAAFEFES